MRELEALEGPIDLVGHDWGGGHVMGVAMNHPEMLRSWSIDVAGIFHPDYVWHDMARLWQTPDVGEETVAAMVSAPVEAKAENYEALGMPPNVASELAAAADETMGRCILALYRDAAQPALSRLAADLPKAAARPGLVVIASEDHYVGTEAMARAMASEAGAAVEVLTDVGHWWMLQDPSAGARVYGDFWRSLQN